MQLACEVHPHESLLQEAGLSKFLSEFPDTPSGNGHTVSYRTRVFIRLQTDPPLRSSQFFWAPNSKENILTCIPKNGQLQRGEFVRNEDDTISSAFVCLK